MRVGVPNLDKFGVGILFKFLRQHAEYRNGLLGIVREFVEFAFGTTCIAIGTIAAGAQM